jgi:hypothetical protein
LRIIAHFQKGKSATENADFLRGEFSGRRNGDMLGRGHVVDGSRYAVWFDNSGMKIGRGESANTPQSATISWEQAAERVAELLQQGTFATQENLDKAWDNEIKDCADELWYLGQACEDDVAFLDKLRAGGFPDDTAKIAELLANSPQFLQKTIDNLDTFAEEYAKNRDILRHHDHNLSTIKERLIELQHSPTRFSADPAFELHSELFITADEKSQLVLTKPVLSCRKHCASKSRRSGGISIPKHGCWW